MFSAIETHKDLFAALQAIATIVALIAGGIWTYELTSQYREGKPKLSIKHDVASWTLQNGETLVRIDSVLTNAGKVHIPTVHGRLYVVRLLPETTKQAENYRSGNIWFDCKGSPNCIPEQGLNVPDSSRKDFEIQDVAGGLEPGESAPYWRYLRLDNAARTIEVYTRIDRPDMPNNPWILDSAFDLHPTGNPSPQKTASEKRKR
jgi:hypothetical protein